MLLTVSCLSVWVLWRVHAHLLERADLALVEEMDELIEELQYFDDQETLIAGLDRRYHHEWAYRQKHPKVAFEILIQVFP